MRFEQLIANEFLAFIQHAIDTMDEVSIMQICKSNFKEEEIRSGKVLLYQSLDMVDRMPTRRRDEKGERSLQDVISLLKETDPDEVPAFVARDLHKLPPVTFDHVDVTRLLKDITTLKAGLAEMKLKVEASEFTISDLRTELLSLKHSDSVSRSPVASNVNTRNRGTRNASGSIIESQPIVADRVAPPPPAAHPAPAEPMKSADASPPTRAYAAAAATPPRQPKTSGKVKLTKLTSTPCQPNERRCDEQGFTKVERRRRKPASRNHRGTAPAGPEHPLRPEVRTTQLYVSRLHWSTKVEEVVDYVRKKSNFTLRVERLE